jgi:selenium-binding protein 1
MSANGNSFHSSPREALGAPPEELLYLACLRDGGPDFVAVIDAEEGRIVHETPMPIAGDELHHFGWNRCSSACHGPDRSHLIVPGFRSSRIHILDVAEDPRQPRIERVIEPAELIAATGYTRPHTVHCMPGGNVVISMLGDRDGNGAGGFAVLATTFELKGRWENGGARPPLNYDFWYQPRRNVLVSSEFGEPNAYEPGFDPADVEAGRYGRRIHFWNLEQRRLETSVDLGDSGRVPLEVRWLHDPAADSGFVAATLSSKLFRFARENVLQLVPAGAALPIALRATRGEVLRRTRGLRRAGGAARAGVRVRDRPADVRPAAELRPPAGGGRRAHARARRLARGALRRRPLRRVGPPDPAHRRRHRRPRG